MGIQKHRSGVDYAAILAGDRGGIATGLDASLFIREEAIPRTFEVPRVGISGVSVGDTAASVDISASSNDKLRLQVDLDPSTGALNLAVDVTLTLAGLTSGAAIEAELETKINAALAAAGQEGRVWVDFDGGDDHYEINSQSTGLSSQAVIGVAPSDDVAVELKLGAANGGTDNIGTDDQDFLLYTTGGPTYSQPVESNNHRTGRFHTGIIRKKKVAEFDIDTMINLGDTAGDSLDTAVRLLNKGVYGEEEVVASTRIRYKQGLPNTFFSIVKVGTIFAEYYTGGYAKDMTLTINGDSAPTKKFTGKAEKASIAGIGQINGALVAQTDVILDAGHAKRYANNGTNNKARVMVVSADGRTITAGHDGSLLVEAINLLTDTLTLSSAVDAEDDGFLVPWHPGAVQQSGTDNIQTDLEGSFVFNEGDPEICITAATLGYVNDHVDFDNCFGADANKGYAAANRATMTFSVTFDLSNENFDSLVQARDFAGFSPILTIGPDPINGRTEKISMTKWIPSVPAIDLPENGTVPVTLEGVVFQSAPGARDPITDDYE